MNMPCANDYFDEYPLDVLFGSKKCMIELKELLLKEIPSRSVNVDINPDADFSLDEIDLETKVNYDGPLTVSVNVIYDIIQRREPEKWEKYGAAWKEHFER